MAKGDPIRTILHQAGFGKPDGAVTVAFVVNHAPTCVRVQYLAIASVVQKDVIIRQVDACLSGEFELTIEGQKTRLKAGDSVYVPSSVLHGALCISEGRLLDIFTPQREDFLKS